MEREVVAFDERHIESAAALLEGAHSYPRADALDVAEVGTAARLVREWQGVGPAVAALCDGALVGFMAATLTDAPGNQVARIRIDQHAAGPENRRDTYRRLYAALSGELVAVGAFEHAISVATDQDDVVRHLFELGFGIDQVKGLRRLTPIAASGVTTRPAGAEDIHDLLLLTAELTTFHAQPPMLRPALVELHEIGNGFQEALVEERRLLLVAEHDGRIAGLMQAGPDRNYRDAATIGLAAVTSAARSKGVGTALLAGVVEWAAAQGFHRCGVEWTSPNLLSDPFWRGHDFDPVRYKLTRLIDARVAWANADLSYRYFVPRA